MRTASKPCKQAGNVFQRICVPAALLAAGFFHAAAAFSQPLTLDQCLEIALARNPEIARARHAREEALAREKGARAGYFPELSLNGTSGYRSAVSTTRQDAITIPTGPESPPLVIPAREIELGDRSTTDLSVSIWQPVYAGGSLAAGRDAAGAALAGADYQIKLEQRNIRRQIVAAFYDLAVAGELEKIAAGSMARITGHLDDARNMLDQGLILKSDLLPIQMRKLDSEIKVVEAQNAVARAGAALARSMGLSPETGIDIAAAWDNTPPWPLPPSHAQPRTRLEQEILNRQIAAADAQARAAKGARRPQIGLTASTHYGWPGFVSNDPDWETWWQAGVAASWNIFDMGRRGSQEQAALAEKRQLEKTSETLAGLIGQERIVSRLAYEEACRRQRITKEKVDAALENYRTKKDHFQAGIATNTDYLDAHTELLNAEFDLAAAQARVRVSWTDYMVAMGLDE